MDFKQRKLYKFLFLFNSTPFSRLSEKLNILHFLRIIIMIATVLSVSDSFTEKYAKGL